MTNIDRREFLRSGLMAIAGLAIPGALAACAKKEPAQTAVGETLQALAESRVKAGARQALDVYLAGADFVRGFDNHLAFGLVPKGGTPIIGREATVWLAATPDPTANLKPVGPITAAWNEYAKPEPVPSAPRGVNSIDFKFGRAATWSMLIEIDSDQGLLLGTSQFAVKAKSNTRVPGEKAIPSQTPTLKDNRGVSPICTREPACNMHQVTLAEALTNGKPVAFIVATPKFCMSRTCGPNLEELVTVQGEVGEQAAFVHAEVYKDDKSETIANQIVSPTFGEWAFEGEPWLFLMDKTGTVSKRFEGPITAEIIRSALDPLFV